LAVCRHILGPAGKEIQLDKLSTRRLAVDVSIWLVQLIRGIRGRDGEMKAGGVLNSVFQVRETPRRRV
jgi:hypothetical protein